MLFWDNMRWLSDKEYESTLILRTTDDVIHPKITAPILYYIPHNTTTIDL